MAENILEKSALEYVRKGLEVFPLQPRGKKPCTQHGYLDATTDEKQIIAWWTRWPDANIGIAVGDKFVVIDLDVDEDRGINGYHTLLEWEREHGKLPETVMSLTGRGGYHYLYRVDRPYKNATSIREGVDIRGEGGYIVAPPSIHPNGNRYEWEQEPGEFPIASADELVEKFLQGEKPEQKPERFSSPEVILEGERNATLFKMACSLQAKGFSESAIRAAVEAENIAKCHPPLGSREIDTIVKSAFKFENGTASYIAEKSDVFQMLAYKVEYDKDGNEKSRKILQTVRNFEIVMDNDCRFAGKMCFDEFSRQAYLMGSVPWESENNFRPWSSFDDSALFSILQADYGLNGRNDFFDAVKNVSIRNKFHPVREILDSLKWDGKEHIRGLLPDYLGADDTEYTYQVMRLWMLGAVGRIYHPGCKFDYTMILKGRQGIGKSTFLQMLSLNDEWFNDSLDSLDSDKAAQSLLGSWIIELAELKSLARTAGGVESVKKFLTATQDKYRVPYDRRADIFLRQCVFAGTTNKNDFLQAETGNRRFLIIPTGEHEPTKNLFTAAAMQDIQAAWAQAVHIWKEEKPQLILPESVLDEARSLQADNMADDGKVGLITAYLEDKQRTCVLEIWQDALQEVGRPQKWQASEINNIVLAIPGWEKVKSPARYGRFGNQRLLQKRLHSGLQSGIGSDYKDNGFITLDEESQMELPFD